MKIVRRIGWGALLAVIGNCAYLRADPLPILTGQSLTLKRVANTGAASNYLTSPLDGTNRQFIVTQPGQIQLLKGGSLLANPFLDTAALVPLQAGGEKGLLGMAFHPDFAAAEGTPGHGKVYTYTSENKVGNSDYSHPEIGVQGGDHYSVIREWTVSATNPDRIDTSIPSRILMKIAEPQSNHNGGAVVFGPDKMLYIALGDGGGGNDNSGGINSATDGHTNTIGNGQDITNVYGKILRINPTGSNSKNGQYGVPGDNPFVGQPGVDEIYAFGLRNPFRVSFDRVTGKLYAGDVGQDAREEVDLITSGGNYGWVYMEGTRVNRAGAPAGLIAPLAEYTHSDGISVIGGFVYRGKLLPQLVGDYIFGDLNGPLFYFDPNDPTGQIRRFVIDPAGFVPGGGLNGWGEDQNGELYALYGNGNIVMLVPEPAAWLLALLALPGGLLLPWRRRAAARHQHSG